MSKYQSPVIQPSEVPQVGFGSMNDTHMEEIVLINRLGELLEDAMNNAQNTDAINDKLSEWVEHTRDHFASEDQLMLDYNFPAYPVHSGEHEQVLAQIEELQQQWQDTNEAEPLAEFIFVHWPVWFDQHVNTMDMVTAQYLSQMEAEDND